MENQPTFSNIEIYSEAIEDNEFFMQYINHELPKHYDANFVLLKYNPNLPEFKMIETMHSDYQQANNQQHLHFHWPENTGVFIDIMVYLNEEDYEIGKQELLQIQPENFIKKEQEPSLQLQIVTEETLPIFLKLNYEEDLDQGSAYAEYKEEVYCYQFEQPHVTFLLAEAEGQAVGSLIIISSSNYLEIDNVLTKKACRKQGVATSMVTHVINKAHQDRKTVILVADAEDTPKEMYKRMGFQTISTQIHAQKSLN